MRRLAPLLLAPVLTLAGCGALGATPPPQEAHDGPVHIRVSVIATTDLAPFWIAQHEHLFADAGVAVDRSDVVVAQSGGASVANLTAKTVDVAFSSYTPFFVAQAKGAANIRLIADGSSAAPGTSMLVVAANSAFHSVHDLAHARIGITARLTMAHLLVQSTLTTNGIDPAGVHWVELGFDQMGAALARGQIDAAYLVQPQLTQAAREYSTIPLVDLATGPTANEPLTGYAALDGWVKAHPDAAKGFHDAMEKATLIARADISKVNDVLTADLHVSAADAELASLLAPGFEHSLVPDRLLRPAQLLHDAGGLPVIPNVAAMIWNPPAGH